MAHGLHVHVHIGGHVIGRHRWRLVANPDREKYYRCSICGKERDNGILIVGADINPYS